MNVRTLCLGILAFNEASGYEIKKAVEDGMFSHFIEASYGSIYPALTQMLAEGLVSVREEVQEGKPLKKAYSITEAGRKALQKSLHELPQDDKFKSEFLFQTLFCAKLKPEHLEEIYDGQLAFLHSEMAIVEECSKNAEPGSGQLFVSGYARACLTAAIAYMEKSRGLLGVPEQDKPGEAAE